MNQPAAKIDLNSPEFKKYVRELLHDENLKDVCVTFTKTDGSEREMHCTLVEGRIPSDKRPKSEGSSGSTSDAAQRVFDTNVGEWRSFRWDSIKTVGFTIGGGE